MKDEKFIDDLKAVLKSAKKGFTNAAGHALHKLKDTKPNIDAVKEFVKGFPDALSVKIRMLSYRFNQRFETMILSNMFLFSQMKESNMKSVAEECVVDYWLNRQQTNARNTLQLLTLSGSSTNSIPCDTLHLDVMKELRKYNLLLKKDIKRHDLIYGSCHPGAKMRFEYLAEWDPNCLLYDGYKFPLSHAIIENCKGLTPVFTMYFQTALQHHPQHLGFLFQKDTSGKTAYKKAVETHGKRETFKVIQQCIPTNTSLPILHRVINMPLRSGIHTPYAFVTKAEDLSYRINLQRAQRQWLMTPSFS